MTNKETQPFFSKHKNMKVIGLLLMAMSILLFLSILSYIYYFRWDQSVAIEGWSYLKKMDYYKAQNWVNKIGVFLGYFFVDVQFGIFAPLIPIYIFFMGVNFFSRRKVFGFLSTLGNILIILLFGTSFLALWQNNVLSNISLPLGGGFGYSIAGKGGMLYPYIGFVGVFVLWGFAFLASMIWFYDFNFQFTKISALFSKKSSNSIEKNTKASSRDTSKTHSERPQEEKMPMFDTIFEIESIDKVIAEDQAMADASVPKHTKKDSSELELVINLPASNEDELEIPQVENLPNEKNSVNSAISETIKLEEVISNPDELVNEDEIDQGQSYENLPPYDPRKDLSNFQFPPLDLLVNHGSGKAIIDKDQLEKNKDQIIKTLGDFNITITSIRATVGPTVTLYEITPTPGIRINKIKSLEDDIALSLAALGIRIIAPIPGKGTIGIEVPNLHKQIVSMRSVIQSEKFQNSEMELPIALGKTISNEVYVSDLTKMPHLLMAGATGKGKSVGINAILISLLYKKHPAELKFVMVDPKKVELSIYSTIENHYLAKLPNEEEAIITDVKKVVNTLNSLCIEMDDRYDLLKKAGVRTIKEYNYKFINRRLNPLNGHKFMPYIVLVIDEFADLIMTAGKEVEMPIARLAQLARAIGIHLIIATQRPSVNVITGMIKANFPARISFAVSSSIDSKTILDFTGAEQLIGQGDMLASIGGEINRIQCAFIDTHEVDAVGSFIQKQQSYGQAFSLPEYYGEDEGPGLVFDKKDIDELFADSAREVVLSQMGSISLIQRKLSIGHNRAGRIMDQLEAFGVVGPAKGSKPREVYFKSLDELERHIETLR